VRYAPVRRDLAPPAGLALSSGFFDDEGGVGPAFPDYGYGGGGYAGGVYLSGGALASATGFASASASEHVAVSVRVTPPLMRWRMAPHRGPRRRW
jgi:hypothetical protein